MNIYKIRHKRYGLYSTGTLIPDLNKEGKSYNKINHVKNHIQMIKNFSNNKNSSFYSDYLENIEIVTFELKEIKAESIK